MTPRRTHIGIGTVLDGRYRLEALIAEGGFGAVYRATHLESGCDVAVKVMRARFATDSTMAARFMREGGLLARLRHPNTVATYELGVSGDAMFIAMELLRGGSLHERLACGPFGWAHAVSVAKEVCAALAEAHALGIVHRDLKPANIHLEPWGGGEQVKVIDFGIAKLVRGRASTPAVVTDDDRELTHVGQVLGTPDYMAPEQLVGEPVDHRTDIYALGVVLYEMLTGRRPFDVGGNTAMLLVQIAQYAPTRPSLLHRYANGAIARELDRVVLRCLAADPDDRFQSVHELADALAAVARIAEPWISAEHTIATRLAHGTAPIAPVTVEDASFDDADERTSRVTRGGRAAARVRPQLGSVHYAARARS